MGPQEKTTTRTQEGRIFVPILCQYLTKTGHIMGYVVIVKSYHITVIVILNCCSLSVFIQYIRLLISMLGGRDPASAPPLSHLKFDILGLGKFIFFFSY